MIIPVTRVALVLDRNIELISLETEWGIQFQANTEVGKAVDFAKEHFTTALITVLDLKEPVPEVRILQYPSNR